MDRAYSLQKKAAKVGFDWPDMEGVIAKIKEELEEASLAAKMAHNEQNIEEELGDLLFSAINLCRFLKVEPSVALRRTNSKFVQRFKYVEKKMKESGQVMKKENLDVMESFWNRAKEKNNGK
jgi:tetrapyrrole methylase family protein/MazG family protein